MDNMRAGLGLQHIGIIMDGNGRWAKKRGLPRKYGHREGAKTFRRIVEYCDKLGLRYLTVYAFSTENWKRPEDEVNSIMQLLEQYIDEAFERQDENDTARPGDYFQKPRESVGARMNRQLQLGEEEETGGRNPR